MARAAPPRIALATTIGGWPSAVAVDSLLANALHARGADPEFILCDGALPVCQHAIWTETRAPQMAPARHLDLCSTCFTAGVSHLAPRNHPVRMLSESVSTDVARRAADFAGEASVAAASGFAWRGVQVGARAFEGAMALVWGRAGVDDAGVDEVFRRFLFASIIAAEATFRLVEERGYETFVIHTPFSAPQGVIYDAARIAGARVITWRRGLFDDRYIFDDAASNNTLNDNWKKSAADSPELGVIFGHAAAPIESGSSKIDEPYFVMAPGAADRPSYARGGEGAFASRSALVRSALEWALKRKARLVVAIEGEAIGMRSPAENLSALAQWRLESVPHGVSIVPMIYGAPLRPMFEGAKSAIIFDGEFDAAIATCSNRLVVAGPSIVRMAGFGAATANADALHTLLDQMIADNAAGRPAIDRETARRFAYYAYFLRAAPLPFFARGELGEQSFDERTVGDLRPGAFLGLDAVCNSILFGDPVIFPAELASGRSAGPEPAAHG